MPKIGTGELVVEKEFDVWLCLEFVEEKLVKTSSVSSEVCLKNQHLLRQSEVMAYSSMNIVRLRLLCELPSRVLAMNHSSS